MATWHQQRNPIRLWHETKWTVVTDPPNDCASLYRTDTQAGAEEYLDNLKRNNPKEARHSYIVRPASAARGAV